MPRTLSPELRDCIERANPYSEYRIEISEPDIGRVLRRQDEFLSTPPLVGAMVPANSLSASARGSLILTPSAVALAAYSGVGGSFDLNPEDQNRRFKGLSWTIDSAFSRATLKSIVAKVQAVAFAGFFFDQSFECQIYQIVRTPGVKVKNVGLPNYQSIAFTEYSFTPLVSSAPQLKVTSAMWGSNATQTLTFDFSNFGLILENIPTRAVTPDQTGILPKYLIVIRLVGKGIGGTGHFRWLTDTVASHTVASVGTFDRVFWAKDNDETPWAETVSSDVPNCTINIEAYPASGQGIYLIDLGKVPGALSTGRIEFQRALPPGTTATVELSTAGSGGAWTAVKHGDVVSIKQQTYHLRTTLTSDAALHATPEVIAQGVEFRIPQDVSVEGTPVLPTREIALPWFKASIPEGMLRVVRTGIRDYLDIGSTIASTSATSRLEADIFLASRHPSITRDKWFRLERMMVSNRRPSSTSEEFTLLSYASRLKRKIPQKVETLNSVHVVSSSTTAQVVLTSVLPGTTVGGNEYDNKNYYMRVRSTTSTAVPVGYVQTIQGSTDTTKLDFVPALPQALVAGDVIEVHSGIFQTAAVSWTNYDPADVWWEVLTNLLAIPTERIGIGSLPRGGKPPKVTDIAPGDATTQAKRKVTGRLSQEVDGDKVLDILSAIMGGVTLEIDGQIVFVQIIPLVDVAGNVTVPLPPPAAIFDIRDFAAPPQTPPGIEARATIVSAKYGVPATAASPDSFPSKATTAVDTDAMLWLQQQDLTEYGTADVPDEIASWFYNTADEGLYLASAVPAGLVKAASTGLRVWPLSMAEKHPNLVPGDVIVIATDQYTDYDPSTSTSIKGPIAVRGVLVRVGNEGRSLSMFVPGLRDNVQLIAGGVSGALTGLGPIPAPPVLSASFSATGQLIVNSVGDDATASQKIAWATGAPPSAATVRAQTPIAQRSINALATGSGYPAGYTTVYVAAYAYSATGVESATLSVTNVASGIAPVALVGALPGAGDFEGQLAYLTTDKKLYRWNGTAWTAAVPTVDLTGTISTAQIADAAITAVKLGALAVIAGKIAASAVGPTELAALAVTAGKVAASAISTTEIAANAVTTGKLAAGAVTPTELAALAVTTAKIAAGAVTATEIGAAAVIAGKIAASAVGNSELAAGAVTASKITALTITAAEIAAGAIITAKIAAGAVTANEIGALAVTTAKLDALAVTAAKIAAATITAAQIAADTITASEIAAGAITTSELAALAVTAAKIAAGTITANEIAAATITGAKIAAATITAANIAADTITASEIAAGAINTSELAAGAVTAAKITALTITAAEMAALTITGAKIAAGTITADKLVANSITAGQIAAGAISATEIAAGAVTAAKIAAGTITADRITVNDFYDRCWLSGSTAHSIATGTPSSFDWALTDERSDLLDWHVAGALAFISVGTAGGLAFIVAKVQWDSNTIGTRTLRITSSSNVPLPDSITQPASAVAGQEQTLVAIAVNPGAGQWYRVEVTQDSGTTRTVTYLEFGVVRLKL